MAEDMEIDGHGVASSSLVTPGEVITDDAVWMRGHGTYSQGDTTLSSVAGMVTIVNKLLSVAPLRGRYVPVIGDHVIGRITEVGSKRWKVDIGAGQDAVLLLGSVNLPGGILRRRSESDELQMRQYLKEGDLLNAEVQGLFSDGGASLHTRSLKYGKLRNGRLVKVPASQVVRMRTQQLKMAGNVDAILGVNGYIWLSKAAPASTGQADASATSEAALSAASNAIYSDTNDPLTPQTIEAIARYANCIQALSSQEIGIDDARLSAAYEASLVYSNAGDLLDKVVQEQLGAAVV